MRRSGLTWAATGAPEIRRQRCNAIEKVAEDTIDEYGTDAPPEAPAHIVAMGKRTRV